MLVKNKNALKKMIYICVSYTLLFVEAQGMSPEDAIYYTPITKKFLSSRIGQECLKGDREHYRLNPCKVDEKPQIEQKRNTKKEKKVQENKNSQNKAPSQSARPQ